MSQSAEADRKRQRSYDNVSQIERALAVLETANRLPSITVSALSKECAIPRPSVVRILETLCDLGFLEQLAPRGRYVLNSRVRALSAGFHDTQLAVEVLRPFADTLTREHLWPVSVATLEDHAMVVRYSTIPRSPLAHARTTLFKRLSLMTRAHGVAYVSFCRSTERHHLIRLARDAGSLDEAGPANSLEWRRMIMQCRERGYALRRARVDPSTATIAVPVLSGEWRVEATLGMTFFRKAVQERQIVELAAVLKAAAAAAAERLRGHDLS
jgi:IclR family mhp operon transcriptional activator